ncbi:hyccin-like [Pollicipes pollicipes]|uniref:hyccin-like n=1 Tax=Pollicipes pollicipes TaxID=41117 RepID=UPI00188530E1|nr:hyccin-like [Pollicipes pollicipes]
MAEGAIHEWIQEWQSIKPVDIKSSAATLMADQDTTAALLRVFEDPSLQHLLDSVCGQLLTFYRSREPNLLHFSLQCLPPLMHAYLNAVATRDRQTCQATEALLLGMYNLEVVDERGQPRVVSFRMPTLIKQSVYHEPLHMAPSSLTEHSLSRLELGDAFSVKWGPLPQAKTVRAANRQRILTALMTVYNRYLSQLSAPALQLEFLHAVYFIITPSLHLDPSDPAYTYCRYEQVTPAATQALEAVAFRGQYEVSARVIVAANAMRNSLNISPAGEEGQWGHVRPLKLHAAIRKIRRRMRFRRMRSDRELEPAWESPESSSGGDDHAHGVVSADSFQWILTPEEHHQLQQWRVGRWKCLSNDFSLRRSRSQRRDTEEEAAGHDIPIQPGVDRDGEALTAISEQNEEEPCDAPAGKLKLKDRKHRPAERERSGPDNARNSLSLNGEEAADWAAPPLARIDAIELRVVSSGSESATPRRERRETDSSSVTSTASGTYGDETRLLA